MDNVIVCSCTFEELLNSNMENIHNSTIRGQLCIPEYQRPYVWSEKQINRLLDDLYEYHVCKGDKPLFYLGSIILHQENNDLKIIDGQQRITTMLLLQHLKESSFDSGIRCSNGVSIDNIKKNISYLRSVARGDIFEYQDKNVIEIIDLSQINITLVVTQTEDLAYTFFETQNTGGVRLSGSDIIKSHHLRAIQSRKLINFQARRWESVSSDKVEAFIQYLVKIRYWDNRNWRRFPFCRDIRGIKAELIEEFTENTIHGGDDVSYHYSAVKNEDGRLYHTQESQFKQIKQPLSDGNNFLDYANDYFNLYQILFSGIEDMRDHRISDDFYDFVDKMVGNQSGAIFLKELLEIAIISYVSRFGYYRLFEVALWLYRYIYSIRVSTSRNVREDSVFKFVHENQFIDNILEVYTTDQLIDFLKRFRYSFNPDNAEEGKSKARHINVVRDYFGKFRSVSYFASNPKEYDKELVAVINGKIGVANGK